MAERRLQGQSSGETRRAVLDLVRSGGTVSRTELASMSGLTEATISKVVKALLDEQLILEVGFADSTGGKRPVLLALNPAARHAIGILLDARITHYVVTDMSGRPVYHRTGEGYGTVPPTVVVDRIATSIGHLMAQAKITSADVLGIGIAAPGRLDATGGVLRYSRVAREWEDFDVEATLRDATGMRVILENDANSAALGEFWSSRLPATRDLAVVYMSAGIGCGIIINGALYRGASGNAGEIGHMTVDVNGQKCFCGRRGCLAPYASPAAIVDFARADSSLVGHLNLGVADRSEEAIRRDYVRIARAAATGDSRCVALIRSSAEHIAAAVVSLVNLLDLDAVYLAGPAFADTGDLYLDIVQSALTRGAFMRGVHPVEVRLSAVGEEAAACGAASMVLHSHLTPYN